MPCAVACLSLYGLNRLQKYLFKLIVSIFDLIFNIVLTEINVLNLTFYSGFVSSYLFTIMYLAL